MTGFLFIPLFLSPLSFLLFLHLFACDKQTHTRTQIYSVLNTSYQKQPAYVKDASSPRHSSTYSSNTSSVPPCRDWSTGETHLVAHVVRIIVGLVWLCRRHRPHRPQHSRAMIPHGQAGRRLYHGRICPLHQNVNAPPGMPSTSSQLHLRDFDVDTVHSSTYPGDEVNSAADLRASVRARLTKANAVFAQLHRVWESRQLPLNV